MREERFKQTEIMMIPEGWSEIRLSDIIEIIGGGTPKTTVPEYWGGDIPWLSVVDFNNGLRKVYTTEKTITEEGLKNSSTRILKKGEIIISARGTVGVIAQLGKDMAFNQSCYGLRAKQNTTNDFVYYLLKYAVNKLKISAHGSVFDTITRDTFDLIDVLLPPISEQQLITKILGAIDDKIALNRSMNSTLEAIGQALFQRWFVDFEFPDGESMPYRSSGGEMVETGLGEVPKGWEVAKLNEIAEFIRGFSYAGSEKSKVSGDNVFVTLNSIYEGGGFKREFSYLTSDRVKERHLVKEGDIIIANTEQTKTGTLLGFPALVEFPLNYDKIVGVFSHHITKVIPFREEVKHFLYHYLYFYQTNAIKYHTGSVIWALDVNGWTNNEKIILPKKEILITFSKLMNSIFQKKLKNNRESNTLENIRDALLPKLMSGEIRVKVSESEAAK